MACIHIVLFGAVLIVNIGLMNGTFSPNVSVRSCNSHKVVIRLDNVAEGGLIYIQGRSSACRRTTFSNKMDYEFDFDLCNLKYDSKFRVIVQRSPSYQTGYDKVVPVMCLVDRSDLVVSSLVYPEEVLDPSVNKTTKPTVRMRMLTESHDVTGGEITLDDKVKMSLTLDDPYTEDFDIRAKDCTAALIPLVKDDCSMDEELFPNFQHMSAGDIASTFRAFQPTNLHGESEVDVAFTCNVAVCKGLCQKVVCGEVIGWGRKRRNANDDDVIENVTVGTTLKVRAPLVQPQEAYSAEYCVEKYIVSSVTVVTGMTLLFSWIVCGCIYSKLKKVGKDVPVKQKSGRKFSDRGMNVARAVGRRLSSIFQLPVGYDVRRTSLMDTISEADEQVPPSKRHDSVTVSMTVDDVIPSCRLRNTFVYQDSSTQTNIDDFSKCEDCKTIRKKEKQSFISNINYYFDKNSEKSGLQKSEIMPVTFADIDPPTEPSPDYDDTLHNSSKAVVREIAKSKAVSSTGTPPKHITKCEENSPSLPIKNENGKSPKTPSFDAIQTASYDLINDDSDETKYRSVLNITKADKNKTRVIDELKNNIVDRSIPKNEPRSVNSQTLVPETAVDENSCQYENSSDECRHESTSCNKETYDSIQADSASSSDSSESMSCDEQLSGNSTPSVDTTCDESILSDDVFVPDADYESVYEAIDIGAQLRARGESINSTHV